MELLGNGPQGSRPLDPRGVPPFIDAAAVRRLTPMPALITALRQAFASVSAVPVRQHYEWRENATLLVMPAWQKGGDVGVKLATICRDATPSVQATYLLMDGRDGRLKAIVDGAQLTLRRTAAASALAADLLARADAQCHLILGTGAMVPHFVEAHRAVRPIERVLIWGRDYGKAAALAEKLRERSLDVRATIDLEGALGVADVISALTLSQSPLVTGRHLKPGAHVDLVGAFRSDMCEADPECFARSRVFVDTRAGVLEEAGDLLQAIASGALTVQDIEADMAEFCSGRHTGRGADLGSITLFKSVGTALEDLAAAELVFNTWSRWHE